MAVMFLAVAFGGGGDGGGGGGGYGSGDGIYLCRQVRLFRLVFWSASFGLVWFGFFSLVRCAAWGIWWSVSGLVILIPEAF